MCMYIYKIRERKKIFSKFSAPVLHILVFCFVVIPLALGLFLALYLSVEPGSSQNITECQGSNKSSCLQSLGHIPGPSPTSHDMNRLKRQSNLQKTTTMKNQNKLTLQ